MAIRETVRLKFQSGLPGPIGPTGPEGDIGPTGPQGEVGPQGPSVSDGDKGDVVVSSSGGTWTIDANAITETKIVNDAVTDAKLANMAEATVKGRAAGAGTGDPTSLSAAQLRTITSQQLTGKYTSAEIAITNAGAIGPLAHGLGARPPLMSPSIICKTTDAGYAVDDEIYISFTSNDQTASNGRGVSVWADATNITGRFGSAANIVIPHKTTGAATAIVIANWRLKLVAYA